jgi:hypothetical protein
MPLWNCRCLKQQPCSKLLQQIFVAARMNTWTSFAVTSGSIWVSCITSGQTARENIFQSHIQGNVCLSPSDGLFPRIYLHGNVFTELLLSSGWFLDCDWQLVCWRSASLHVANSVQTNGCWWCHGQCWLASAWFNVGGSNTTLGHLNGILHKSLSSVIINTTASQTVEVITLRLLECPNWSSWKLVCTKCHLMPSQQCISQFTLISSNTNTVASQIALLYRLLYTCLLKSSFYLSYQILNL